MSGSRRAGELFEPPSAVGDFDRHKAAVRAAREEGEKYERRRRWRAPKRVRDKLDRRDGHACRECGTTTDLTVDHIEAVIEGGSDDLDNLQWLCSYHNPKKEARRRAEIEEMYFT